MIAFAGKQGPGFQLANVILSVDELAFQFLQKVGALCSVGFFLRQMDIGVQVARQRSEFLVRRNLVFGPLAIAQNVLRRFLIAPEIRLSDAGFQGLQALAMRRRVKDSSEPWRCEA